MRNREGAGAHEARADRLRSTRRPASTARGWARTSRSPMPSGRSAVRSSPSAARSSSFAPPSTAGRNGGRRSVTSSMTTAIPARTSMARPRFWGSVTCTSRTSGRGGTPRVASSGGSTTSTRPAACRTRTTSSASRRARASQSRSGTRRRSTPPAKPMPATIPTDAAGGRRPRVPCGLPCASRGLRRRTGSGAAEGRSAAVHPGGGRGHRLAARHRDQQAPSQGRRGASSPSSSSR